jgi:hypothetical protein
MSSPHLFYGLPSGLLNIGILFSLVRSFTAKGIYLKQAPSGFDPERSVTVDFLKTGPNWLRKV